MSGHKKWSEIKHKREATASQSPVSGESDGLSRSHGKGAWYFISVHECPICGRTEVFRERREDARPERYEDRHDYFQTTGCGRRLDGRSRRTRRAVARLPEPPTGEEEG